MLQLLRWRPGVTSRVTSRFEVKSSRTGPGSSKKSLPTSFKDLCSYSLNLIDRIAESEDEETESEMNYCFR